MGELTVQAAWVALLALAALTLAGWHKPARATPESARGDRDLDRRHPRRTAPLRRVRITPLELERPPSPLRRVLAGLGATLLSAITGAVIAIVLSFLAVIAVVWATGLLGR